MEKNGGRIAPLRQQDNIIYAIVLDLIVGKTRKNKLQRRVSIGGNDRMAVTISRVR